MKLIINADDCGCSPEVNRRIEEEILARRITSTTVMANMDDFEGAVSLYRKYGKEISFGVHLNLTEGSPLLRSEELICAGVAKEISRGGIMLNGNKLRYKYISKRIRKEIFKEFDAQIVKVLDSGIRVSHIDSHHHIHNGPFILPAVTALAKKYRIRRIRNMRNYMPLSLSRMGRHCWTAYLRCLYPHVLTTDYFTSYREFLAAESRMRLPKNATVELMCHPGGAYPQEEKLMAEKNVARKLGVECVTWCQFG